MPFPFKKETAFPFCDNGFLPYEDGYLMEGSMGCLDVTG